MKFTVSFLFALLGVASVQAQWSNGWAEDHTVLNKGLEAYEQQLFARAQADLQAAPAPETGSRADARYRAALSAVRLSNRDAEFLVEQFLNDYPAHPLAARAIIEMADHQFVFRRYREAADWYARVDAFLLKDEALNAYRFKWGYSLFSTEEYPRAAELFAQVKDQSSAYAASSEYYFGHIAYADSNYAQAETSFEKLREDPSFGPVVPYYLAQIYYKTNQDDELLQVGQSLLKQENVLRAEEINRLVADAFYKKGDYTQAAEYLERYRDLGGRMFTAEHYQLGYCYFRLKRWEPAVQQFNKITEAPAEISQQAHYHLAECYLKTGEKSKAMTAFEAASQGPDPDLKESAAFNYVKLNYEITSPYQDAITAIQQFLQRYPASAHKAELNRYLANLYLTTKDYARALTALRNTGLDGIEMRAAYQKVSYYRGVELYNLSQWQAAREHFLQSLQYPVQSSYVALAHYWTAEVDYRLNDYRGALAGWETFRSTPGASEMTEFRTAAYNSAYAWFRLKDWQQAARSFRSYADDAAAEPLKRLDASARVADCYFLTRGYLTAIDYYERVIKAGGTEEEYARFQQSICLGLADKDQQKISKLQELIRKHPDSRWAVDARFELASTLLKMERNQEALTAFDQFLLKHPSHSLAREARVKQGLLYRNLGQPNRSAEMFRKVVEDFPSTEEANEAISFARLVYAEMGKMQEYVDWVESIEFADVKRASLDSALYFSAYDRYASGEYDRAATELDAYRNRYPDGLFVRNALLFAADAYYRQERRPEATARYEALLEYPGLEQEEVIRFRLGELYRAADQQDKAVEQYRRVLSLGTDPQLSRVARLHLMRDALARSQWKEAMAYAEQLLADEKAEPSWKSESTLTRARALWALESYEQATDAYATLYRNAAGAPLAEAGYHLALYEFRLKEYAKSSAMVYELLEKAPNQTYWRDRALLLLAENFFAQDDPFQAKYTLDFLRENSTDREVLDQAEALQKRMDAPKKSPLGSDENTDGIQLDEGLILEIPDEDEDGTENN